MRHTAYNDYAAESRVRLFSNYGLSLSKFNTEHIGPVLFKEETNFLREIAMGEDIKVEIYLKALSSEAERFTFTHDLFRDDRVLAARIEVYGAWIDLEKRKLITPPEFIKNAFLKFPRSEDFEEIRLGSK